MRWRRKGVRQRVFNALAQDADNEYAIIDSTMVRAHRHAAGAKGASKKAMECIGRSRGGPSTKSLRDCFAVPEERDNVRRASPVKSGRSDMPRAMEKPPLFPCSTIPNLTALNESVFLQNGISLEAISVALCRCLLHVSTFLRLPPPIPLLTLQLFENLLGRDIRVCHAHRIVLER